ncbi:hypothetical protein D3C85_1669880 [compost metagenome]
MASLLLTLKQLESSADSTLVQADNLNHPISADLLLHSQQSQQPPFNNPDPEMLSVALRRSSRHFIGQESEQGWYVAFKVQMGNWHDEWFLDFRPNWLTPQPKCLV